MAFSNFVQDINSLLSFIGTKIAEKSTVSVAPDYTTGTRVAVITVNNIPKSIYVPGSSGGVEFIDSTDVSSASSTWKYEIEDSELAANDVDVLSRARFMRVFRSGGTTDYYEMEPNYNIVKTRTTVTYYLYLKNSTASGDYLYAITPWSSYGTWSVFH